MPITTHQHDTGFNGFFEIKHSEIQKKQKDKKISTMLSDRTCKCQTKECRTRN